MGDETPIHYPMTAPLLMGDFYSGVRTAPVHVRIGQPAPDPMPGGDFYCPVEVCESESGAVLLRTEVFGINPLQAVELAFHRIREQWPMLPTGTHDRL